MTDRFNHPVTVHVVAIKRRTGERIDGITQDDGLQDLWPVTQADGSERWVSSLDTIIQWEES